MANKTNKKKSMSKEQILWIAIIAVAVIGLAVCGILLLTGGDKQNSAEEIPLLSGIHYVEIDVKDVGKITAELYADTAPITVTNFINLADQKFYDGLTFHRIINGFMVQGGRSHGQWHGRIGEEYQGRIQQ